MSRTRRQVLTELGTGVVALSAGGLWETTEAKRPPYPEISENILDEYGWMRTDQYHETKSDAKWRISTYEWYELRDLVREETDGVIDIPLGGLIAMRIGNDGKTRKINGRTLSRGETFFIPTISAYSLRDSIDDTYQSYLDQLWDTDYTNTGELNWNWSTFFPITFDIGTDFCMEGGTLTTERSGEVDMTQHFLEYELREDTAHVGRDVDLTSEETLEFRGWEASWDFNDQIYVVLGVHPNNTGGFCGLSASHFEAVVDDVVDATVDLDIENTIHGRMQSVMGAVQ